MKKILIVDDSQDMRDSLQAILEENGFETITAYNSESALKGLAEGKPDLILMDVMMDSEQEGFEIVNELKSKKEYSDIPVIIVSGIEVFTCSQAAAEIAIEMRKEFEYHNMNVIVLKDALGNTGIDYISEQNGKSIFLNVKGFHAKPVVPERLIDLINKFI
ncbi:MAG: response regulator [Bacteroidales bacterium]|nr:response regulator [Bacteroidales bacterium]